MKAIIKLILVLFFGFQSAVSAQNNSNQMQSEILLIDRLAISDSYDITIRSIGCFNNTSKTISIFRNSNEYIAVFNDSEIILSPSKIDALRNFESQLKNTKTAGCTTIDTYILKYGPEKIVYRDDTCSNYYGKVLLQNLGLAVN